MLSKVELMKKELFIGTVTFVLVFALIYMPTGYAQNLTKNASNAAGNAAQELIKLDQNYERMLVK